MHTQAQPYSMAMSQTDTLPRLGPDLLHVLLVPDATGAARQLGNHARDALAGVGLDHPAVKRPEPVGRRRALAEEVVVQGPVGGPTGEPLLQEYGG